MKRVAAAKFKEQCLALLDRAGAEGLVIAKYGKRRLLYAKRGGRWYFAKRVYAMVSQRELKS